MVLLTGIITDDSFIIRGMHPVPNRHATPEKDFAVFGRDINPLLEQGYTFIGVIHSHLPDYPPWPTEEDLDGLPSGLIGGVYHTGTIHWYMGR